VRGLSARCGHRADISFGIAHYYRGLACLPMVTLIVNIGT